MITKSGGRERYILDCSGHGQLSSSTDVVIWWLTVATCVGMEGSVSVVAPAWADVALPEPAACTFACGCGGACDITKLPKSWVLQDTKVGSTPCAVHRCSKVCFQTHQPRPIERTGASYGGQRGSNLPFGAGAGHKKPVCL